MASPSDSPRCLEESRVARRSLIAGFYTSTYVLSKIEEVEGQGTNFPLFGTQIPLPAGSRPLNRPDQIEMFVIVVDHPREPGVLLTGDSDLIQCVGLGIEGNLNATMGLVGP